MIDIVVRTYEWTNYNKTEKQYLLVRNKEYLADMGRCNNWYMLHGTRNNRKLIQL